jgi:hypothetical protein
MFVHGDYSILMMMGDEGAQRAHLEKFLRRWIINDHPAGLNKKIAANSST